jgi:epoxyqueuosine reductase QueG
LSLLLRGRIEETLKACGVYDVGFSLLPDAPEGLPYGLSIVAALSDAVVDEICGAPTHTYFHHYRTVNAFIDSMLLRAGMLLQSEGYRYLPVAASQTINTGTERGHMGRYSHKKAAVMAGLGSVGKSTLFLHRELGPRVRLGTLFTDCQLTDAETVTGGEAADSRVNPCGSCELCVKACPARAITGARWSAGLERESMFDAHACNDYVRKHFMGIGRGSICGICMRVCGAGTKKNKS